MKSGSRFDLSYFLFGIFATLLGWAMCSGGVLGVAFILVGPCPKGDAQVFWAQCILGLWAVATPFLFFFALRWFWRASRSRL